MFHTHYRGRSAGRVFHYIYKLCGLHYAERVQYSGDTLTYNDRHFATVHWVRWSDNSDIEFPEFEFAAEYRGRPSKLSIKPHNNRDDLLREAVHQAREARELLRKVVAAHDAGALVVNPDSKYWPAASEAIHRAKTICPE